MGERRPTFRPHALLGSLPEMQAQSQKRRKPFTVGREGGKEHRIGCQTDFLPLLSRFSHLADNLLDNAIAIRSL